MKIEYDAVSQDLELFVKEVLEEFSSFHGRALADAQIGIVECPAEEDMTKRGNHAEVEKCGEKYVVRVPKIMVREREIVVPSLGHELVHVDTFYTLRKEDYNPVVYNCLQEGRSVFFEEWLKWKNQKEPSSIFEETVRERASELRKKADGLDMMLEIVKPFVDGVSSRSILNAYWVGLCVCLESYKEEGKAYFDKALEKGSFKQMNDCSIEELIKKYTPYCVE